MSKTTTQEMSNAKEISNAQAFEATLYQTWESLGAFKPQGDGEPYCIMLPPPNVTGSLHMGHAFQQTLMDILIRYHRMLGRKTLWQVGTDHAGIATQMVVERQLAEKETSRHDLGREKFIDAVWRWKETSGGTITRQMRRLGVSVDWSRERFTMDEGLSAAVLECFVRLYEAGLIYRGKRLVNWDPALLTAVSDLEVESKEEQGCLWYIRYPLASGDGVEDGIEDGVIVVATTRPETLLGDVAVAVHPEDERYKHWIGKQLRLPLTDRFIPIIADDTVLPEFGTGAVKITPAHDFNDYAIGEKHELPKINIFTEIATLNDEVPERYRGLDRFVARKQIVKDLTEQNLLEKIEAHKLMVPRGDRSNAILEPRLTDQWYVDVKAMAEAATKVVETGEIQFVPENWSKTYFEWMHHIQDWCISRQLWWGHRIPAWYDEQGNIFVGRSEPEIRQKYNLPSSQEYPLKQEEDVLDTWFSSALWPISTLGWPENAAGKASGNATGNTNSEDLNTFYPTQVLITGFDIIFFWVARMIMFGLKFTDHIPFKDVYINAILLDQNGQKMSKTKGNVLDPLDLIDGIDLESLVKKRSEGLMQPKLAEQIAKDTRALYPQGIPAFGTDALRFTYAAIATPARYIRFDLNRIEGYRHFCNKLRNAARYVLMNTEGYSIEGEHSYTLADQWILTLWQKVKTQVAKHLSQYRFDLAALALYEFTWNEYCDWYLEASKSVLLDKPVGSDTADSDIVDSNSAYTDKVLRAQSATRYTLLHVLEELLRVIHPFMPYITEELWQKIPLTFRADIKELTLKTKANAKTIDSEFITIMLQPYPTAQEEWIFEVAETEFNWLKQFVMDIRNFRSENQIPPAKKIKAVYITAPALQQEQGILQKNAALLLTLAKLDSLEPVTQIPNNANVITANGMSVTILSDVIDKAKELERIQRLTANLTLELKKITDRLTNASFREKAPKAVVEQDEKRANELEAELRKLETQEKQSVEKVQFK